MAKSSESKRIQDAAWKMWGPYLSERQWGTVREDYSEHGTAWEYFPHDMARSRTYRWGEDGIGGISDSAQQLCFAWAFWNGKDPIIKERLFGLTGNEGNHGEDVKELYYYLDSTPTHSYMKMLYKYPQQAFPYTNLVHENRRRTKSEPEFELIDTGIFDGDRYFDCEMEYAKRSATDLVLKLTIYNRGMDAASITALPHLWFRNEWSWNRQLQKPNISLRDGAIVAEHDRLGSYWLTFEGNPEPLFCDNETNLERVFGVKADSGYFKDGINNFIVSGTRSGINPKHSGTKVALRYQLMIPAGESRSITVRLSNNRPKNATADCDAIFAKAKRDADEFYETLQLGMESADARLVQRQALAGMLWSKQFYYYNINDWIQGDADQPTPPQGRSRGRNASWQHLNNCHVISMPDKWEYPWYAAWDLAFHTIPLALVDAEFAKEQLLLLTHDWYLHPNGQIPAYEWNFSDVNPPVHAWATWRVYKIDQKANGGQGDREFLERVFQKLLLNFTWWVNRKDEHSHNIFQGGFLGLDNIGVFDRSAPLPTGGHIEQADGTAWVGMYCLNLMRIALELARFNSVYEDLAIKFFEHFLLIAKAMINMGGKGLQLWDSEDEFYYDVLHTSDGNYIPLRIRSIVGIIPLFAVEVLEPELLDELPEFKRRLEWILDNRPELAALVSRWHEPGKGERRLLSLVRGHRMKCILRKVLDENEFLSAYGVRAVSKYHEMHPYEFRTQNGTYSVRYQPGESDSGLFGGNSNWRGPIWMPINYLLVEALQKFHHYYGDDFRIQFPVQSASTITIADAADEISRRLGMLFMRDEQGRRAVLGDNLKSQRDPHFSNYIPFHEYFHGDTGRGVGASHQTGWTGLIAKLLMPRYHSATESSGHRKRTYTSAINGKNSPMELR